MAEPSDFKKRKLELCISPHSVLIQFDQNAISLSASMPPLYLRISRGSRSVDSSLASLERSMTGSMMYTANWENSNLAFNVTLIQQSSSGNFDSKEIKIQLKIDSGDTSRQKSLASCTYDISCLNFSALDFVKTSSETRQISLRMGKSASAAIRSILLEATFHYNYLEEEEDVSVEKFQSHRYIKKWISVTVYLEKLLKKLAYENDVGMYLQVFELCAFTCTRREDFYA